VGGEMKREKGEGIGRVKERVRKREGEQSRLTRVDFNYMLTSIFDAHRSQRQ